jgi:hypothetical protein
MIKSFRTADIRNIGGQLFSDWENVKNEIKLPGRGLFRLLTLKKAIEAQLITIEEALASLSFQFGGTVQENGGILIPPEQRAEAGKAFQDFGEEMIEIKYDEIVVHENDFVPISVLEALLDFIVFADEQ